MRRTFAGALGVATAPFVVLFVRSFHVSWGTTGDYSLIELRTRAVGGSHTPLLGPYSRFGWDHPGPALFFALAAPYRLFSSRGAGLLAGTALIGGCAVVGGVVVLLRAPVSRLVAGFGLLVVAILVHALGPGFLWDPWNPYVIVLPFLALVLLSWWAAIGEDRVLPFAVALASFVIQTHVSVAPEAAVLLVVSLVSLVASASRDPTARRRLRRSIIVAVVVGAVMWSPPVIQQLQPHGGNLRLLWLFWTKSHHQTLGFTKAARVLASEFSIPAPWITGHEPTIAFTGSLRTATAPFPFALLALVGAFVVAWRRRDRVGLAGCYLAAIVVAVAWVSIARIFGPPYPYLIRWVWAAGALCWFASGVALLPVVGERIGRFGELWLTRAIAIGATLVTVVVMVGTFTADAPNSTYSNAARVLVAEATPHLRDLPSPVLVVTVSGDSSAGAVAGGFVTGSIDRGIDARYPESFAGSAGSDRVVQKKHAATLIVVANDSYIATYARNPTYREIAQYDSLTHAQRRDFDRITAELNALPPEQLPAFVAAHRSMFQHLQTLSRTAVRSAVFLLAPPR